MHHVHCSPYTLACLPPGDVHFMLTPSLLSAALLPKERKAAAVACVAHA